MDERCVFCGDVIPEGRQVCPTCEKLDSGELKNPCKGCKNRNIFCHITCKSYNEWSKAMRKVMDRQGRIKDHHRHIKAERTR